MSPPSPKKQSEIVDENTRLTDSKTTVNANSVSHYSSNLYKIQENVNTI